MALRSLILAVLSSLLLASCAPLVVGGIIGGAIVAHNDDYHRRCMIYYGNPNCRVSYGQKRGWVYMPMGVHR